MAIQQHRILNPLQQQLVRLTQAWAAGRGCDLDQARALRRELILANHRHYLETIPAYTRLAHQEGLGPLDDLQPIKQRLMFPDDLYKSYNQQWLDENDFARMNDWLSQIHHRRVNCETEGLTSIDAWIERLAGTGVQLVYSSGTSGNFSFIPRDAANWSLFRTASTAYLATLLMRRKVGTPLQKLMVSLAGRLLSPESLARSGHNLKLSDTQAFFLDFNRGWTGNQSLERELVPLFRGATFLYETDLSPSLLRLAARGPRSESERSQLAALQETVLTHKDGNYLRLIERMKAATARGQKVFLFGSPYQCKELCETIQAHDAALELRKGSLVLFGGGWKSFKGESIPRQQLVEMMVEGLGLSTDRILEGYSMTEINAFMLRCDAGRFHIPPYIEPVLFDEQLEALDGRELRGTFGFLDPLATSYPGFLISGDQVHFVDGKCACGLDGAAVTEIGRAGGREVKGCGGILASLSA